MMEIAALDVRIPAEIKSTSAVEKMAQLINAVAADEESAATILPNSSAFEERA
jgi:hypothetical protein